VPLLNKTKIICTIGPASNDYQTILALIDAGMNVARLNFSHGTHEEHAQIIAHIQKARKFLEKPVGILLDTKGPEVRLGKIAQERVILAPRQIWKLVKREIIGDEREVSLRPATVLNEVKPGEPVLIDDGYIVGEVEEVDTEGVSIRILNGGVVKSGKGVNFPSSSLSLPSLTEQDEKDIRFGCNYDVDYIAASFTRSADDVLAIKRLLKSYGKEEIQVFAKIENHEGVNNFDSILQACDGILIARGDLGVEMPLHQVPRLQKMMIRKCYLCAKPAITATQMLESMIHNPRPTRAEVSDVANAIYDSSAAVMLSGETAAGKYPVEAVKMMRSILVEAEKDFDHQALFQHHSSLSYYDVQLALTFAAVQTAYSCKAKVIFGMTTKGHTARLLARLRPKQPIIAFTENEKCYHQLAINWGVYPLLGKPVKTFVEAFHQLSAYCIEKGIAGYGDLVVATLGAPFGVAGTTNTMVVENLGDVLVRAQQGEGASLHGKVVPVLSLEETPLYRVQNKIILLRNFDQNYLPLLKEALGVVLENHPEDTASAETLIEECRALGKTCLCGAEGAFSRLINGMMVTLDTKQNVVYKGVVLEGR
jgi:pyruvate kinase